MSLLTRTGAIFVAVFLTLGLMAPQTAQADATTDKSVTNASTWIADTWKNQRKQFFAAGTTADGVIALSAANQKPDTVRSMLLDLKDRGPRYAADYPAGLAKMIMTADIAGQNPRNFFGCERDLVADLQKMVKERPSKSREYWGPYLIAIALTRSGEQVPDWVIEDMEKNQNKPSGGFGYYENDGSFVGDPDYTAVGISAMDRVANNPKNAKDKARTVANVEQAKTWSAESTNQRQDAASNSYYWQTFSSTNSTGMLASSLGEVGVEIESPVRYLVSQQNTDGGWAAAHKEPGKERKSDVMASTQAVLGVIGKGYGTARSTQVPEMQTCGTTTPTPTAPVITPPKVYPPTVYNTPGYHNVNGREWFTTCEPYSQTKRCTTTLKATTVKWNGARYVVSNDYIFNNLSYLPSPRALWKNNPLAGNGAVSAKVEWTTADGRKWSTECDTANTGRGGCRTYATASVIETITRPGQSNQYKWVSKEIFNSMVQFS